MRVLEIVDDLIDLPVPDDANVALGVVKDLIALRSATEPQLAVCAAVIDESGIARTSGSTTSKVLQSGVSPVSAYRWSRIGPGLTRPDRTAGYSWGGFGVVRACGRGGQGCGACRRPVRGSGRH